MELAFRPLQRGDFPLLSRWLAAPHVQPWWREDPSAAAVEERYGPPVDGSEPTELFVVELGGRAIGMIQRYRLDDEPEWARALAPAGTPDDAAGIDYLIGEEELIGRGLGVEMIERLVAGTFERYPDISAVVVSVLQENRRSWRALEKAGFRRWWSGIIVSDDPSDEGPSHVYVRYRSAV